MSNYCNRQIAGPIDVGRLLDEGRWSGSHTRVSVLVGLCLVLDGFDNQALSFALPTLIRAWHLPGSRFALVLAIGLVGVSVGNVVGGTLGDRYGRRPTLIGSALLFGTMSAAIGTADGLVGLTVLRFLASVGLGAAMPVAVSFITELAPVSLRAMLSILTMACFPLGGAVGGVVASRLLPGSHWGVLFVIGGGAACLLALSLWALLPESPRYLLRAPSRRMQLEHTLASFGHAVAAGGCYFDSTERPHVRASLLALFDSDLRWNTFAMWIAFSCSLLSMQLVVSWVPTLLASRGIDAANASLGLSAYNLGGVIGAVNCAFLAIYLGSRSSTAAAVLGAALVAQGLSWTQAGAQMAPRVIILTLGLQGFFSNAAQTSLAALAAHAYPTSVRATGSGAGIAVGRCIAAVAGAFAGPPLIAVGLSAYFQAISIACVLALTAVALLRPPLPAG